MSAAPLPPRPAFLDLLRIPEMPIVTDAWNSSALYDAAREQGLCPLVIDRLRARGWPGIGSERRASLERERQAAIALETLSAMDMADVLGALRSAGVQPLVTKGAALAHTHYAQPWLRPRVDTDLLIRRRDIDAAHAVFTSMGAACIPHVTGQYVMSQFHYVRTDRAGCQHTYDVHWRLVNPLAFAGTLTYEDMAARAVPLPNLGDAACTPDAVHALLLGAIHRAAHHAGGGPLVWLFDIHLLAESLDEASRAALVAEAVRRRVAAVTAASLDAAHAAFGGSTTRLLAERLGGAAREPSARFLRARPRLWEALDDLRSVKGVRRRAQLAREWLFPPAAYMRDAYGRDSALPLPLLYTARAVRGARRWCRRR